MAEIAKLLVDFVVARAQPGKTFVLGICGSQGSGKSTAAARAVSDLAASGLRAVTLSLDDLYLTHMERRALARSVHPLLMTRGVPGTHDVALGLAVLAALKEERKVRLPRFDKACDDRADKASWQEVGGPVDVVLFEGWCIGARPQPDEVLATPINELERNEDADGLWRCYANRCLAGDYQTLFDQIDALLLVAAPNFEIVINWRQQQEAALRGQSRLAPGTSDRSMSPDEVVRFVSHYERLTRHVLKEMPPRADCLIRLDEQRRVLGAKSSVLGNRA